jgi:hypothetical protein
VTRSVYTHYCEPQPRTLADIIHGRQVYKAVGNQACFVDTGTVKTHFLVESLTLERGKIRYSWRGPVNRNMRYENGEWIRDLDPYWMTPKRAWAPPLTANS